MLKGAKRFVAAASIFAGTAAPIALCEYAGVSEATVEDHFQRNGILNDASHLFYHLPPKTAARYLFDGIAGSAGGIAAAAFFFATSGAERASSARNRNNEPAAHVYSMASARYRRQRA